MKLEDIPTPITDELLKRNAQSCNLPQDDYESLAKLSENLERKLACLQMHVRMALAVGQVVRGSKIALNNALTLTNPNQ